ncbi:Pycsar system effector family protein [Streptomyces sp. NPDC002067]
MRRTAARPAARRATAPRRPPRPRPATSPTPDITPAAERLLAANLTELTRADTKAAVLLGFLGAVLGAFVTVTREVPGGHAGGGGAAGWWSAVGTALLAVGCFVGALAPRRRKGRADGDAGPGYFEQVAGLSGERLAAAFARAARDPAAPALAALRRTSEIVRAKYRWIETGTVLLLVALPQFAAAARPW